MKLTELLSHPEIKTKISVQLACLEGLGKGLEKAKIKNKKVHAIFLALEKTLSSQNDDMIRTAIEKIKLATKDKP